MVYSLNENNVKICHINERWDENRMKKIAVFSNMYPSAKHPTFGLFVKNQVDLLKNTGQEVDVVAITNPEKGRMTTLKKYAVWFLQSLVYMMKNKKNLSLTHAHYVFPTGLISLIGKKWMGIPYVVTSHGGDIDKMAAKSGRIAKLTKKILHEAEAVIVVGEKLKLDVVNRFGIPENNVHVMSMGVNTGIFKTANKKNARESLNLSIEGKVILFVGNVIEAKGLLELVEAFAMLQESAADSQLYIVGSRKDSTFESKLQVFIQDRNVKGIQFVDPVGQEDLALWMAAADVLALPSYHEGFGLVALEAMAVGTRVVATNVGGLPYLLADGGGILVEAKDANALANGLEQALRSESTLFKPENAQQKVSENSFEAILDRLLQIYRSAEKSEGVRHE